MIKWPKKSDSPGAYNTGWNDGLDACQAVEKAGRMSVESIKKTLLEADLEFYKQPTVDDEYSDFLAFLAKSIYTVLYGEGDDSSGCQERRV